MKEISFLFLNLFRIKIKKIKIQVEPVYANYKDSLVVKSVGDMWSESCAAEGWPLPQLQWVYKNSPVSNATENSLSTPYTINHHRNFTVTSYLIAQNLSQLAQGVYSCVLNGNKFIKNVTLQLNTNSQDKNINNNTGKFKTIFKIS